MNIKDLKIIENIRGIDRFQTIDPETFEAIEVEDEGEADSIDYDIEAPLGIFEGLEWNDIEKFVEIYEETKNKEDFAIKWNSYFGDD